MSQSNPDWLTGRLRSSPAGWPRALRPITEKIPKALIPVADQPFLPTSSGFWPALVFARSSFALVIARK